MSETWVGKGLSRPFTILLWVALLAAVLIEISGFRASHILQQPIWFAEGLKRFLWLGLIFTCLGAGLLFRKQYLLPLTLGAMILGTVIAVGPSAVGAVLLFIFSATVLGKLVFGRELEGPVAVLGGTAIWILIMTCIARLPVHYRATYLVALALPLAISYPIARRLASGWLDLLRPSRTPSLPEFLSVFLVAFVAAAHWLVVLEPEVGADGLAMHLATASNIALHHAFTIDFHRFIWALMPMGADWCYSVVYVLGGEYAARLLNFALLAVIGLLLFGAARRFVSNAVAMFMVFLFLSTPLVQLVTGSLFVENFVAAMCLGAAVALWKFWEESRARWLMLTAFLLGTSIALKLGTLALGAVMVPLLAMAIWRNRRRIRRTIQVSAAVVLLATAAMPYLYAYGRSGNPIFPFENVRFHSADYANENLKDPRYAEPVSWWTPLQLTFNTSRYYEGQDGSFGLQYLLLLPLTLVCLGSMRSFAGLSAAAIGLGGALIIAATLPNARYFYPVLPFLALGATAALGEIASRRTRIFQFSLVACLGAGLLNLYLLPASGWYHKDFVSVPLFSEAGRQKYLQRMAPVRELVAYLNRVDRIHPVVFIDSSALADLIAPAYALHWHNYAFQKQAEASEDPEQFYHMLAQLGVRRLLVPSQVEEKFVATFLARCAQPEYSVSGYAVVEIAPGCEAKLRAVATEPLSGGKYDETDARLTFIGNWTSVRNLPLAYQNAVAFTGRAGAQVRFKLKGRGFRYGYTGAPNRGMAEILVDSSREAVVDLYSPNNLWQAQVTIAGLVPGVHDIVIRALAQQNASATGHFVDIDFIEILGDWANEAR